MTIHGITQYLKYKWKAKSRHGIHSPFVYAFVEDVIEDRKKMLVSSQTEFPDVSPYYTKLFDRIIQYYHYKNIQLLPAEQNDNAAICDVLILPPNEPLLWAPLANKYFNLLKNDTAVFVINIHATALHTHEWNRVCAHQKALMSIDLYGVGLLFFKDEFKEKQHFVLKY